MTGCPGKPGKTRACSPRPPAAPGEDAYSPRPLLGGKAACLLQKLLRPQATFLPVQEQQKEAGVFGPTGIKAVKGLKAKWLVGKGPGWLKRKCQLRGKRGWQSGPHLSVACGCKTRPSPLGAHGPSGDLLPSQLEA